MTEVKIRKATPLAEIVELNRKSLANRNWWCWFGFHSYQMSFSFLRVSGIVEPIPGMDAQSLCVYSVCAVCKKIAIQGVAHTYQVTKEETT